MNLSLAEATGLNDVQVADRYARLTRLEQSVLDLRFVYCHDLLGTAARLALTRQDARRIEREALRKMREAP